MEAAGIEPASRDVSMSASTCIVAVLFLAGQTRLRHGSSRPAQPKSRSGNRATPEQQAHSSSSSQSPRAKPWGTGHSIRQPLPFGYWHVTFSKVFNEAALEPRHATNTSYRPVDTISPPDEHSAFFYIYYTTLSRLGMDLNPRQRRPSSVCYRPSSSWSDSLRIFLAARSPCDDFVSVQKVPRPA